MLDSEEVLLGPREEELLEEEAGVVLMMTEEPRSLVGVGEPRVARVGPS